MDLVAREKAIANFIRFVDKHKGQFWKQNRLALVSNYRAWHSFATNSIRKGASKELIQKSIGQGCMTITQHYFAWLKDNSKLKFAQNLMYFQ